jgi:type I restriction enzyme S subunit
MQSQRLDAVADITMGQAPEGESYNLDGEGLPLIAGAGDFGELSPKPKKFTTAPGKSCQAGDVILGIRATIGEKVLADGTYCLGRGVAGLRPKAGLDACYLWHWLSLAAPVLASKAKGATFKQVTREDIGELRIPLPPLSEQRRIAAILDKADELRAKRRAALKKLDELTQSIFLDMFGDPATNPKGWPIASLGDVILNIRNGVNREQRTDGVGWPITRIETIADGIIDQTRVRWIDPNPALLAEFRLEVGDILFSHINSIAHIGKTALYAGLPELLIHGINLLRVRPNREAVEPVWLLHILKHDVVRTHFRTRCKPAVNQASLNQSDIKCLQIFLPPLPLQRNFVRTVQAVDTLGEVQRAGLSAIDQCFASLQHRAFRGEL